MLCEYGCTTASFAPQAGKACPVRSVFGSTESRMLSRSRILTFAVRSTLKPQGKFTGCQRRALGHYPNFMNVLVVERCLAETRQKLLKTITTAKNLECLFRIEFVATGRIVEQLQLNGSFKLCERPFCEAVLYYRIS